MTRLFLSFSLILLIQTLTAQNTSELERRHGFKSLKLDMPIDSVKGYKLKKEFKERDEFLAKLYTIENPEYATIGEVTVDKVEVKTYKDIVYQIHVVTEKDPRLMKALESIYGLAEYDHKHEIYFWKAQTLVLKFKSKSKNQLEMIYTSFSVNNLMKEDKNKKVQNIADDF